MAGLPWFKVRTDLARHPKTRKLGLLLKNREAVAFPLRLFTYCADGRIAGGELAIDVLEEALEWRGTRGELVQALLDCGEPGEPGFLEPVDGGYLVHDWEEENAAIVAKFQRDAKKPRGNRPRPASVPRGTTEGRARDERGVRAGEGEGDLPVSVGDRSRGEGEGEGARGAPPPTLDDEAAAEEVLAVARRVFRELVGRPYEHASRKAASADRKAAVAIYRAAAGDLEDVAVRWRTGLQNDGSRGEWPVIRTLAQLAEFWAEFSHSPVEAKAGLRRLSGGA
jgi:hypothetical protein